MSNFPNDKRQLIVFFTEMKKTESESSIPPNCQPFYNHIKNKTISTHLQSLRSNKGKLLSLFNNNEANLIEALELFVTQKLKPNWKSEEEQKKLKEIQAKPPPPPEAAAPAKPPEAAKSPPPQEAAKPSAKPETNSKNIVYSDNQIETKTKEGFNVLQTKLKFDNELKVEVGGKLYKVTSFKDSGGLIELGDIDSDFNETFKELEEEEEYNITIKYAGASATKSAAAAAALPKADNNEEDEEDELPPPPPKANQSSEASASVSPLAEAAA